jgi:hypothetical protein
VPDDGLRFETDEEQIGEEPFALAAQIVVDVDGSVKHIVDEAREGVVEVGCIGPHGANG